jgi:hypothetical protein
MVDLDREATIFAYFVRLDGWEGDWQLWDEHSPELLCDALFQLVCVRGLSLPSAKRYVLDLALELWSGCDDYERETFLAAVQKGLASAEPLLRLRISRDGERIALCPKCRKAQPSTGRATPRA